MKVRPKLLPPTHSQSKGCGQAMGYEGHPRQNLFHAGECPPFSPNCSEKSRATCEQRRTQQILVGSWVSPDLPVGRTLRKKGGYRHTRITKHRPQSWPPGQWLLGTQGETTN